MAEGIPDEHLPPLVEMDCYDAIELLAQRPDAPSQLLSESARRVADLWNDPPDSLAERIQVEQAFPALADALWDLLGGGPCSSATDDDARGS